MLQHRLAALKNVAEFLFAFLQTDFPMNNNRYLPGTIETKNYSQFYLDVVQGLSSSPKYLSSKYFYDAKGDKLFQEIMLLP